MGILNIVFGSVGILCGLCGIATLSFTAGIPAAPGPDGPGLGRDLVGYMNQKIPGWFFIEISKVSLTVVLSLVLIIAGIGLLNMRNWGRILSLVYAILAVPFHASYLAFQLFLVVPAAREFNQRGHGMAPPDPTAQGREFGALVGVVGAAGVSIVYALVLLTVMLLPQVAQSFAAPASVRGKDSE
jgi:hypothetical protein